MFINIITCTKIKAINILTALILLLSVQTAQASLEIELEKYKEIAKKEKIWEERTWLKLLHYEKYSLTNQKKSTITSEHFFLSRDGKTSPQSELIAMIESLFTNDSEPVRCQFIARSNWVISRLNIKTTPVKCDDFEAWANPSKTKSVSIIMATGFFENPASFYGHLLLKFNQIENSNLLDTTINFGAAVPENENPILYVMKGIFGGYDASFTYSELYSHQANYGEIELRDLWEYKLNLSEENVRFLQQHLWELKDQSFTYLFSSENCAYHMGAVLELVYPFDIVNDRSAKSFWVLPVSIFLKLNESDVVKEINFIPSRQSRFQSRYLELSDTDQKKFRTLSIDEFENINLLIDSQATSALIETSIEYVSLMIKVDKSNAKLWGKKRAQIILARLLKPEKKEDVIFSATIEPPHLAQKPSLLEYYIDNNKNNFLRLRPANFDTLSLKAGRLPYSKLEMLDTHIGIKNDKIYIKEINFIDIISPNISATGIKGDGGFSWRTSINIEEKNNNCEGCLLLSTDGGVGKTIEINQSSALFAYAMARAHIESKSNLSFYLGYNTGFIYQGDNWLHTEVSLTHYQSMPDINWNIETRLVNSTDYGIRLNLNKRDTIKTTLHFGLLF